ETPEHESQILPDFGRSTPSAESFPERLLRARRVAPMQPCHADVVQCERVARIELERLPVRPLRRLQRAALVGRDAALVPQLRAALLLLEQRIVQRGGVGTLPAQQRELCQRLAHQPRILATLQRKLELA